MAYDDRDKQQDDEYQYPEEEYNTTTQSSKGKEDVNVEAETPRAPTPSSGGIKGIITNNPRVSFVVGFAIIILIAFKIMGHHTTTAPIQATASSVEQTPSAQQQMDAELFGRFNTLKQTEETNRSSLSDLRDQVTQLRSALDQLNSSQSQLSQALGGVAIELKNLSNQIKAQQEMMMAKPTPAGAPPRKMMAHPATVYHIQAIVEGRAWIVSSNGLSMSVTVGDNVPDYGKVQSIDANTGRVMTSSGKVIELGANDR